MTSSDKEAGVIGDEVRPLPVVLYGRRDDTETDLVRRWLEELQVPFVEIDIDQDAAANRYVERVNHGQRLTPTLSFGNHDYVLSQPERSELLQTLRRAGYEF